VFHIYFKEQAKTSTSHRLFNIFVAAVLKPSQKECPFVICMNMLDSLKRLPKVFQQQPKFCYFGNGHVTCMKKILSL